MSSEHTSSSPKPKRQKMSKKSSGSVKKTHKVFPPFQYVLPDDVDPDRENENREYVILVQTMIEGECEIFGTNIVFQNELFCRRFFEFMRQAQLWRPSTIAVLSYLLDTNMIKMGEMETSFEERAETPTTKSKHEYSDDEDGDVDEDVKNDDPYSGLNSFDRQVAEKFVKLRDGFYFGKIIRVQHYGRRYLGPMCDSFAQFPDWNEAKAMCRADIIIYVPSADLF